MNARISLLAVIMLASFAACDSDDKIIANDDYFPLKTGTEWSYDRYRAESLEEFLDLFMKQSVRITGDTMLDGKAYKLIRDSDDLTSAVRKEGSAYYRREFLAYPQIFNEEILFLDTAKPEGGSWTSLHSQNDLQIQMMTVVEKHASKTFFGRTYDHVIVVETQHLQRYVNTEEFTLWLKEWHYYAPGYGEIYSYVPYPLSYVYLDLSSVLTN